MLELCAASSFAHILLNHSSRVKQLGGAIEIKMRKDIGRDFVVFTQVDGEFMKVLNPKSFKLKLADWLKDGSINVLRRNTKN